MLAETPPPEEELSFWNKENQPGPVVEAPPDDCNDSVNEANKGAACHPEVRAKLLQLADDHAKIQLIK